MDNRRHVAFAALALVALAAWAIMSLTVTP